VRDELRFRHLAREESGQGLVWTGADPPQAVSPPRAPRPPRPWHCPLPPHVCRCLSQRSPNRCPNRPQRWTACRPFPWTTWRHPR
jgi:hypothetical protein